MLSDFPYKIDELGYDNIDQLNDLEENIRELDEYDVFLKQLGSGSLPTLDRSELELHGFHTDYTDLVEIPQQHLTTNLHELVDFVFPNLIHRFQENDYLNDRMLLSTRNNTVQHLNKSIYDRIPDLNRCASVSYSIDRCGPSDDPVTYNEYVLNQINVNDLPPHELHLKDGCVYIVLRNLNIGAGLTNGTRVKLLSHTVRNLRVEILSGDHAGKTVIIPRIPLTVNQENHRISCEMTRFQFPIRLAFALTISKAQGQTIGKVGIYLPAPVFSHGLLNVAFTRVGNPRNIKLFIRDIPGVQGRSAENPQKVFTRRSF